MYFDKFMPCWALGAALVALHSTAAASTVVSPGDPNSIPGVSTFDYDAYYVLGGDHTGSYTSVTDAYSWDHPNLQSADPVLGEQTGWTHLTKWVAVTLTQTADLTVRLDRASGVQFPDQNNPGAMVGAGDDLIPALTIWTGAEALAEDKSLGLGNQDGGHRWDNDGNLTTWMDQLVYLTHDGNLGGADHVEITLAGLSPGEYTINVSGHKGGAFDPGTVPGDLTKGFTLTLTTIPEPGSSVLVGSSALLLVLRRRKR